ncbi:hypothetical protein [Couchioplanes azureus]|uniref:hypothetical protein n=1 Tax=Couchioplanes caeruleus TaxID=56438 RepID=UPI0016704F6F|nr:hypothetical protein [Couchioplanes caeruleus]GGQ72217.1 hypothetical protein GCM10010166_47640 [Couchioplanes caeruleus subsp. azureus]
MSELSSRIEQVRTALAARPDGIKYGKFPPGRPDSGDGDLPPGLSAVLALSDGPRGGEIVVYSRAELAQQDFSLDGVEAVADPDVWTRFATLNDEPLLIHQDTGEVWWFPDTGVTWLDSTEFEKLTDDVATFMTDYLLGDGYLDICATDDPWARLLVELGWAHDDEDPAED